MQIAWPFNLSLCWQHDKKPGPRGQQRRTRKGSAGSVSSAERKVAQAYGIKRLIVRNCLRCTEMSVASQRLKLCDVVWNMFSEMDKVLPWSCIIWIIVFRQKSKVFKVWPEMKWKEKKKRVMKAQLRESRRHRKCLFWVNVLRKNVFNPHWKIFSKCVWNHWASIEAHHWLNCQCIFLFTQLE